MRKLISVLAMWIMCLPVSAQQLHPLSQHPDGVAWPTNGWEYGEMTAETASLVQPLIDKSMAGEKPEIMGETRSIVIVHRGRIVAEAYRDGFTKDTKQISWSIAKSVTNSLVGRAVHLGLIESIDDPMPTPHPEDDPRSQISWRHWLNMTEGLSNDELDQSVGFLDHVVVQMMFGRGRFDVAQFHVDEVTPLTEPGDVWKYSTPGYHMIGWALDYVFSGNRKKPVFSEREFDEWRVHTLRSVREEVKFGRLVEDQLDNAEDLFARAKTMQPEQRVSFVQSIMFHNRVHLGLFGNLGMLIQPEFDAAGTYLGGSNVWASAHDYAKFGYLYLRDGIWEGGRLLPEGWVDFSRTKTTGSNSNTYGAGFWITSYGETPTRDQAVMSPPWDSFNANGSEGQTIWIVPSRDIVIVRLGQMENNTDNWNALFEWCQEIARAFPEVPVEN